MSDITSAPRVAAYTRMDQGTVEDYALLDELARPYIASTGERALAHLELLAEGLDGNLIDRYQHSLQSATRALRNGERVDLVVGALLHDVGDAYAPENHSEAAAALLAPYVDDETHWVIEHHGLFQGYYYFHHLGGDRDARERYRGSPHYDACVHFCAEYDQNCFDPGYDTLPLEELIAKLHSITNIRVVRDEATAAGWKIEVGPFPGWAEVPTW